MPALPSTAWSHLPNAQLIDQLLASLKKNPEKWNAAPGVAVRGAAWDAAWEAALDAVQGAARGASRNTAWDAVRNTAWDAVWDAARGAAWDAARGAAWGAILALLAWDNCAKYLSMTSDQLSMWAVLSESPAAILLQPYMQARELIDQLYSQEATA